MSTITFETGQKVNFNGTPTQADIEEVAKQLGITKPSQSAASSSASEVPKKTFLEKAGDVVNTLFPGKQIGNYLGTKIGYANAPASDKKFYDQSTPTGAQLLGDASSIALTLAAPGIGSGSSVLGRITANTLLGTGLGISNSLAGGATSGDEIGKAGQLGGLTSGLLSAGGESVSMALEKLPSWFVTKTLPKLKPENAEYVLNNTPFTTTAGIIDNSNKNIEGFKDGISKVLSSPKFKNEVGDVGSAIPTLENYFSNSGADADKIVKIVKQVAPGNRTLVDKVLDGTANLLEQETLKKELDLATRKAYGDNPILTFNKQVGKTMADFLRDNIQTTAKETVPLYAEYTKELNLNSALRIAQKASLNVGQIAGIAADLAAFGYGYYREGFYGGAKKVAEERLLRSPSARLQASKLLYKSTPLINAIGKTGKMPLLQFLTSKR